MKDTKDRKFLKIQEKPKYCNSTWGWILELWKTIKQFKKTRQIHQIAIQTHCA
jgi:hypothetical protein